MSDTDEITALRAEVERLRARLEIDPSHPYDGIYARNETIRQQDKQIDRLRAALKTISLMDKKHEHDLFSATQVARAVLEGK